jgi:hypothetical protein
MKNNICDTLDKNRSELKNYEDEFNSNDKRRNEYLNMQNKVRELQQKIDQVNNKITEKNVERENQLISSINSRSEVSNIIAIIHDLHDNLYNEIFKKKKKVDKKEVQNLDELNIADLSNKLEFFKDKFNLLKFIYTEED